jgi:hypothetical protein
MAEDPTQESGSAQDISPGTQDQIRLRPWLLALCALAVFSSPWLVAVVTKAYVQLSVSTARRQFSTEPEGTPQPTVVVIRGPERQAEKDLSRNFRGSTITIYMWNSGDSSWNRIVEGLPCRSTTTNTSPALETDFRTYGLRATSAARPIRIGNPTIPPGVYRVDHVESTRPNGLLLSDEGRNDGYIVLPEPARLYTQTVFVDSQGTTQSSIAFERVITSKGENLIHGTPTRYWSHTDSLGCITLLNRGHSQGQSTDHWGQFVEAVRKSGLIPAGTGRCLIVERAGLPEDLARLPERLTTDRMDELVSIARRRGLK